MREYYILFNCDEWKGYSSMRLVGVFNRTQLIKILKRRIKKGEYEFGRDIKEIDNLSIQEIDASLVYGYIQETRLNEILD